MGVKLRWAECTFCGEHATLLAQIGIERRLTAQIDEERTVPCCYGCRKFLGKNCFDSVVTAARHVAERLAITKSSILWAPGWSDEELEQLEDLLGKTVKARQSQKLHELDKLRHCLTVIKLNPTAEEIWSCHHRGKSVLDLVPEK